AEEITDDSLHRWLVELADDGLNAARVVDLINKPLRELDANEVLHFRGKLQELVEVLAILRPHPLCKGLAKLTCTLSDFHVRPAIIGARPGWRCPFHDAGNVVIERLERSDDVRAPRPVCRRDHAADRAAHVLK